MAESCDVLPLHAGKNRVPRYFFNMYDGVNLFDKEGIEIPNLKEMRIYMLAMASEIMTNKEFGEDAWQLEVLDERGGIVATMEFNLTKNANLK